MKRHSVAIPPLLALLLTGVLLGPIEVNAQTMTDYTAAPPYISKSVSPNILFIVDLSEAMLPAAYGSYPESRGGRISSNLNGTGLCNTNTSTATNPQPGGCPTANAGPDAFDPTTTYFGMFNPIRCYTWSPNYFTAPVEKPSVSSACMSTQWDGNFLNWLAMRKIDLAKKVLIGGRTLSASNNDGTANTLLGEPMTGSDGSTATCSNAASFCFRFVKQANAAGVRYPSALPMDGGGTTYFGVGEGKIYVSSLATEAGVFGAPPGKQFLIWLDLTTESDAVRRDQSTGMLQSLRTDNMRVGVMFTNSDNGKAARVFREFDGNFNSSAITGIRNQQLSALAALAEGTYEGLCYYRNSQGACYSNSPADFTASVGAQGDPFFLVSQNQMVSCCKSFILMVSSGQPTGDGGTPDRAMPFGNLFQTDTVGLSSTWLDDIALYGKTHDIRDQGAGTLGFLNGTQNVTFYSVNAMGGAAGSAVLASAAKYGGFEDRNGNSTPDLAGQTCTYPAGSTLGTGTSMSDPEWDLDQDCVPDTYFEASEGSELKAKITNAIADILKRAASGTSVSVLATSATGEGALYQAFFFPSTFEQDREIKWTGYTQGLFLDAFGNLREDTNGDGKLVYEADLIIKTRFDAATGDVKVDRYPDYNGDGQADSPTPVETVGLKDVAPIWEAGKQLALKDPAARRLLTWVDSDNDGRVDAGEQFDFNTANAATLSPYLRAGASPFTADNLIRFIRGEQVPGLRDRQLTVAGALKVWKLGDPVHATPVIVGAPKERYDVLYGDASYTAYFQQYRNRRQVAYVGANDGMLHAFNVGFYHRGDDPATTSVIEHGRFTRTATDNSSGPLMGDELWGFIPYQLLPHLRWLAQTDYTHVYYVDLKPKVTDARIFTPDADHPNGWGTILIGGFRMGGSCSACASGTGAPPMTVTANFGSGMQTRTFYSAYFVLDVTNPEADPKLIMSFTDTSLGLTTSYPAVLRVNPSGDAKTSNTNAKWVMEVGSGPTGYDASSAQTGRIYAINLATGPGVGNSLVTTFATSDAKSFMGDMSSVDVDLDYRADVVYSGDVITGTGGGPVWTGKLYRLTTGTTAPFGGNTLPTTWGFSQQPTVLLADFLDPIVSRTVGPITAAPTVTTDEASKVWVFWGTGRYYSTTDKTNADTQYLFGVKDPVVTAACTQSSLTSCEKDNLLNVSAATICVVGQGTCGTTTNQVTGVSDGGTTATSFSGSSSTALENMVQSKDGWFTTLPAARERSVVSPTLIGGTVFFPTFVPVDDICTASGSGNLYALFYKTGSAYKESVIGTYASGGNTNVNRSISLGSAGMASQMAVHIGGQGSDSPGTSGTGGGCAGRVTGFIQSSTGTLSQLCTKPPGQVWSRYISWLSRRD